MTEAQAAKRAEKARRQAWHAHMKALGMDWGFVPYSTHVNRNRCHNQTSDRLWRRRGFLIWELRNNGNKYESRHDFVMRAAELRYIEDELCQRGMADTNRKTRH